MGSIIAAQYYLFLYLFIVSIITFAVVSQYEDRNGLYEFNYPNDEGLIILLVTFFIFFIGFRPVSSEFVDMKNYANGYYLNAGKPFFLNPHAENFIFDNLYQLFVSYRLGIKNFCFIIAAIYYGCAYLGVKRIFPTHTLSAYIVFLAAFSTFSYGTNGIKAGAAASLFIWALSYRNNLTICIVLILLSFGFHHSMQLPVVAFVLSLFYKNSKIYFYAWAFCMLMAVLHVSYFQNLFAGMTDETGSSYLMKTQDMLGSKFGGKGGFRIDFILYSAMPVFVGYNAVFTKELKISDTYRDLLHLYLCTNGVWMLCMYANFTNRIAYLSWFLYPIVLIYPFLYEDLGANKYVMFRKAVLYHLAFTVFMEMVYYGGFAKLFF